MSATLSAASGALGFGSPPEDVSIVIGNTRLIGWETVSITRSVEAFPNSFVLTAADPFPDDPSSAPFFPTGPGEPCKIYIGPDLVINGFVDQFSVAVGGGRHALTIQGRGVCCDLRDCSAVIPGATLSAANTLDLARQLAKPFGITCLSPPGVDAGKPINFFTVMLGETPYEIIERVARYAAYLVYEDQNGALVLDRVGTNKMASGFSMPGNIEGANSTLSIDQRFSNYTVVWNSIAQYSEVNPLENQRADLPDPAFIKQFPNRFRPKIIVSEQYSPDSHYGQQRANWELARRIGRSQAISLTCDSWRDTAGKLWQPNYLAPINAPALKIVNKQWIIGTVTFRKDQSGTHADLTLMPPDAFSPEPTVLNLWDRETMTALTAGGSSAPAAIPPQDGVS